MGEYDAPQIAWMVIPERHPVIGADETEIGYVAAVLGDHGNGRFDGVVMGIDVPLAKDPRLLVEVDQIVALNEKAIITNLSATDVKQLPTYEKQVVWQPGRQTKRVDKIKDKFQDGNSAWDRKK